MVRRKRNALMIYSILLLGALLGMWLVPFEGEERAPLQNQERRLSNKTEHHGKQACTDNIAFEDEQGFLCQEWARYNCSQAVEKYSYSQASENDLMSNCHASCKVCTQANMNPIHELEVTEQRLANQADWHRNVRGHYIAAAAVCSVLIYLIFIVIHVCMKRLKYEGLFAVPDHSDEILRPVQWISLEGDIYEVFSATCEEGDIYEVFSATCEGTFTRSSTESSSSRCDSDFGRLNYSVVKVDNVNAPDEDSCGTDAPGEDDGDELFILSQVVSRRDSVSVLQVGELLSKSSKHGKEKGAFLGDAIHWRLQPKPLESHSQSPESYRRHPSRAESENPVHGHGDFWRSRPWYKCEYEDLSAGDPVVVLDDRIWRDGIIDSFEVKNDGSKVYNVLCYGHQRKDSDDTILPARRRTGIRKLNIATNDRMRIGRQIFSYYFDKVLDFTACGIYIWSHQWIHLAANLFGVFWNALESAKLLDKFFDAFIVCDTEQLERIFSKDNFYAVRDELIGVAFWRESRESWRRCFPSIHFIFLRSTEASVEGMVSLIVQSHAFLFTSFYTFTEQCLMAVSIIMSASNYAIAAATEDYEIVVGQKLEMPHAQREFKNLFFVELQFLQLTRMVSSITRICCVASFSFAFRPFGVFIWLISTISKTYAIFRCIDVNMGIGDCIWNAFSPENWVSISEPYLMNEHIEQVLQERGAGVTRKIVNATLVCHGIENLAMYVLMYTMASENLGMYLLHGHRCLVFMVGLLGLPLAWVFEFLAFWIATSSRFRHVRIDSDGQ